MVLKMREIPMPAPTTDPRERMNISISRSLKQRLEKVIPEGQRSQFAETAMAEALSARERQRALDMLDTLPSYDTGGQDSVEVLRQQRKAHGDRIVERHKSKPE